MTNNGNLLELSGIHKRFGRIEALTGVDLEVREGEFFGFLGPNGAGKSTLLKILSGFIGPDSGAVRIRGREVGINDNGARRTLGLVPQEIALYDTLSPLENLRAFGHLYHLERRVLSQRSQVLLESVGLWDRRNDPVKDFSGGMKRRLNIVVALLHEPEILLCDEPTVGVDPQSRNAIFEFLDEKNRNGLSILYTTHYMEEAERLCQRIAILDNGRILGCGTLEELLRMARTRHEILIQRGPGIEGLLERISSWGRLIEESLLIRFVPTDGFRLSRLYALTEELGIDADRISVRKPSLESLFLQLTGHRLRD